MSYFPPLRDSFLDELLRHEGRGDFGFDKCHRCANRASASAAVFRCRDCDPGPLMCAECTVASHQSTWCHRIQVSYSSPALSAVALH